MLVSFCRLQYRSVFCISLTSFCNTSLTSTLIRQVMMSMRCKRPLSTSSSLNISGTFSNVETSTKVSTNRIDDGYHREENGGTECVHYHDKGPEIRQGRKSKPHICLHLYRFHCSLIRKVSEKLLGKTDIEEALKKLGKSKQVEVRSNRYSRDHGT